MRLTIDFETRSTVDLKEAGPWKYAEDPTTDVICLAVKEDDNIPWIWLPDKFWPSLEFGFSVLKGPDLVGLIDAADTIEAHNVEFERAIWHYIMHERYGFPDLDLNKCDCSAARAAYMALPRKLEKVCEVLKAPVQKDMAGHKLMLKMCKPRKPRKAERKADPNWKNKLFWYEEPEDIIRLCGYCIQDVEAEYSLSQVVQPLSPAERKVWLLDQRINQRGVYVDLDNINSIIDTLQKHEDSLLNRMKTLTGRLVSSPRQVARLREWLLSKNVETENLQKQTVKDLLKNNIPREVREVLTIRQALGKASTSKFGAMINRAGKDGRCRSLFMYSGAGTHRWTAKAIQPQNMVRDSYKGEELEQAYEAFQMGDIDYLRVFFDDPFPAASRCLRGAIMAAPGKKFICADYSSIEARGNAWQAGEEKILEAFRQGADLYKLAAVGTFGVKYNEVNSSQRQLGKVQILALGYQGGIGAFAAMANGYGIDLETLPALVMPYATQDELEGPYGAKALATAYLKRLPGEMSFDAAVACDVLKRKWRADNPSIVKSWRQLENAAFEAVTNPGEVFRFRKVKYRTWRDSNGNNYLLCQLPSGRVLFYFDPKIREVMASWGEKKRTVTCRTVDSVTKQWIRRPVYGGLLCENIVQSFCRDLLAEALLRVEAAGYKVVMHVHDEIISEVDENFGSLEEFCKLMEFVPPWAEGMPIKAEGWVGKRFRKG